MTDVRLYAVAFVLWVEKREDYVRIFGLRVDRGIDKSATFMSASLSGFMRAKRKSA